MVSVIIPTYNESKIIAGTLTNLLEQKGNYEIIICDGGSGDDTLHIAKAFPQITIVSSGKGRALQMNAATELAKGDTLLFLHADTLLPENAIQTIEETMTDASIVGGSFFIKFNSSHYLLKFYAWCSKINHTLFTYGDQGIFMRRSLFQSLNGFKPIPIMEDIEIQQRMRKRGKFVKLSLPVVTSARRFVSKGIFYQQWRNILLVFLFILGVSAHTLKKFYSDSNR